MSDEREGEIDYRKVLLARFPTPWKYGGTETSTWVEDANGLPIFHVGEQPGQYSPWFAEAQMDFANGLPKDTPCP